MTDRNYRIRFMENNFAELIEASVDYTSQLSSFPFSNCINKFRSRVWKPSGNFTITEANKEVYINDGADKTVSLVEADYATPALLTAHIQTQLNTASSGWTVAYDSAGETYKFTISNSGSVTLRLSQTINAVWDALGYTLTSDIIGTSFLAQEQRNHTNEGAIFDLGYNATIQFAALIGPLDEIFPISTNATITLMGSNLDQWEAPPFSTTIDVTDLGAMKFLDIYDDTGFRFWNFVIEDRENPNGPEGLSIGHLYLGDYITLDNRNISNNFGKMDVDPSETAVSESGILHFDTKTKYSTFDSMTIGLLERADKDNLRTMFNDLGKTTPFYVSLDPTNCFTDEIGEMTKYVVFSKEPKFKHVIADTFSMSLSLREVI